MGQLIGQRGHGGHAKSLSVQNGATIGTHDLRCRENKVCGRVDLPMRVMTNGHGRFRVEEVKP